MNNVVQKVRQELISSVDQKTKESFGRFFKDKVSCYGVKTAVVEKIAKKYWTEINSCSKKEIFALCEKLYYSGVTEEAFVAAFWLPNLTDLFEPEDLSIFRVWIESYIDNWAKCDSLCNHTVGLLIEKFPKCVEELKLWALSENQWLRRASAVSLIVPAKRGKFLMDVFQISDILLCDKQDMVQKGYGWLLKESSRQHQKEVFNYVLKNKHNMPRTALRYAIELMPKDLKLEAMRKG